MITVYHATASFKASGIEDDNNCTVLALSNATGWDYKRCDEIATKAGRKRGKGFPMRPILESAGIKFWTRYYSTYRELKVNVVKVYHPGMGGMRPRLRPTLAQCIKEFSSGRFIVLCRTHAFAIVNGKVLDNGCVGPRTRVFASYELTLDSTTNTNKEV